MATIVNTSYQYPGSVVTGTTTGNLWENPNNILLPDEESAIANASQASDIIVGNFADIALDQDAIVVGIKFKIRAKGSGTLTFYAVDSSGGEDVYHPYTAPFSGLTPDLTYYEFGTPTYLFDTAWTPDMINNLRLQIVSSGGAEVDIVEAQVFYYIPTTTPDPEPTSENCLDCNSQIQAQPFYLALPFNIGDRYAYLTSFNYPNGELINMPDLGACGGFVDLVFDEGQSKGNGNNFEENARTAVWETLTNGMIRLDFVDPSLFRGLDFKTPYGPSIGNQSNHDANSKVIISNSGAFYDRFLKKCHIDVLVSAPIIVSDENTPLVDPAHNIDFRGAGVTAVNDISDSNKKIITIPGAGGSTPPGVVTVNTVSVTSGNTRVTDLTTPMTISGLNRGLLVRIAIEDTQTVSDVTYGGTSLTLLKTFTDNGIRVEIWLLIAPPVGTDDVVVTLSGSSYLTYGCVNVVNMDQTTPLGSDSDGAGSGTAVAQTDITTQDYSLVFDIISTMDTPIIYAVGPGQNQDWQETAVTTLLQAGASFQPAGVTPDNVVMSWTLSKSALWAAAAVEIKGVTTTVPGSGQSAIQFQDEGTNLGAPGTVDDVDFVGAGVLATRSGNKVTVTVPGGGGGGAVDSVTSGDAFFDVDNTDPANPVGTIDVIAIADDPGFLAELEANLNVGSGGSSIGNLAEQFDDFVQVDLVDSGATNYQISRNFAIYGGAITTLEDHPGIVTVDGEGPSTQLIGFANVDEDPTNAQGMLNSEDDFDISWLARLEYGADTGVAYFSLENTGSIKVQLILDDSTGTGVVKYSIGAGAVSTGVTYPTDDTWFTVRIVNSGGTVTITLDGVTVFTGAVALVGQFYIANFQTDTVGAPSFDVDWVRTVYRAVSTGGGSNTFTAIAGEDINGTGEPQAVFVGYPSNEKTILNITGSASPVYSYDVVGTGSPGGGSTQVNGFRYASSFVPTKDVTLNVLNYRVNADNSQNILVTVKIDTDSAGAPSGSPILTQVITAFIVTASTQDVTFRFDNSIQLQSGVTYWIDIEFPADPGNDIGIFQIGSGDMLSWNGSAWVTTGLPFLALNLGLVPYTGEIYKALDEIVQDSNGNTPPGGTAIYGRGRFIGYVDQSYSKGDTITVIHDGEVTGFTDLGSTIEGQIFLSNITPGSSIADTGTIITGHEIDPTKLTIARNANPYQ